MALTFFTGLILLREAWDAVDKTNYLASQYKRLSRLFYFILISESLSLCECLSLQMFESFVFLFDFVVSLPVCSITIVTLAILGDPSTDLLKTTLLSGGVSGAVNLTEAEQLVEDIGGNMAYVSCPFDVALHCHCQMLSVFLGTQFLGCRPYKLSCCHSRRASIQPFAGDH